jgi:hypothetical protein
LTQDRERSRQAADPAADDGNLAHGRHVR